MERGLTNLLLEEGEEERCQVDMAGTVRAMEDDLCMLGHSEAFFLIQILHGRKELSLEWDLPIWASPKPVAIGTSCWLWEEGPVFKMGDTLQSVYSGSSITQANIQGFFQHGMDSEGTYTEHVIGLEFWNINWLWRVEQPDAMKLLNWNLLSNRTERIRRSLGFPYGLEDDFEGNTWRFTGFYGLPVESRRRQLWDLLRQLASNSNHPWIVMGDFNEVLFSNEKQGGRFQDKRLMEDFYSVLEDTRLSDLGYAGH
ncbi:hypothetical protein Golax_022929 [Gossypium laxum]|uniref:Endonuclease/exonuclease/phosphatase domain-containing protein n=1 Tax=Gossypium laxum TaxID=34288 RepID=A0A7J9B1E8_9ROSI|nr:hypothetical protein [Gossypium laxum]